MAIENFGGGMTDAQLEAYRRFKSAGGSWDEFQQVVPDYEHEIAQALDSIFDSSKKRLRRIILVALAMAAGLLAVAFVLPFLQH